MRLTQYHCKRLELANTLICHLITIPSEDMKVKLLFITGFIISSSIPSVVAGQNSREDNAAAKPGTAAECPVAKIVHSKVVKVRSDFRSMADLAAFKGRLFLSFLEHCGDSDRSCIRVMSSEDGVTWETAAVVRYVEPGRYLMRRHEKRSRYFDYHCFPRLDVVPGKRLSLRIRETTTKPDDDDLQDIYDLRKVGWSSADGTEWKYEGALKLINGDSRTIWHGNAGFAFDFDSGVGDGAAEELWIRRTTDGAAFKLHYTYELPKYAPRRGSLFFVGERAYFLMPRYGSGRKSKPERVRAYVNGELGTSAPPYREWTWKEIDDVICSPHVVHVPGKGTFAVVELRGARRRTSLCKLDVTTGKLTELLSFGDLRREQKGIDTHMPFGAHHMPFGLAVHQGHIWMSYCSGRSVKVRKIAIE